MHQVFKNVLSIAVTMFVIALACRSAHSGGMTASADPACKLALVTDGANAIPIVVAGDATPLTKEAAVELADYIEKISGARPEIVVGAPEKPPAHAIWVGYQPAMDGLFPKVDFDFAHAEEILIAANENHLVIAGRDRWVPPESTAVDESPRKQWVDKKGKIRVEPGAAQTEYGTANAVYTFLEKYLDLRWLWPGELGEDYIEQPTLAFEPFEYRYHPQMRERDSLFRFSSVTSPYGHSGRWTRRQCLQLDSWTVNSGHAFSDWWERFHDRHPEYFALQPDGTRGGGEEPFPAAHTVKLCLSNPDVAEQWLKDVEQDLKENPNQNVFTAASNDGWVSGHCMCEKCRAWDHPEGELRHFHWSGMGQRCVALSDRHVTFANRCAKLLKQRFPDREYYVSTHAYGHSRPAPIQARPADNVIITSVANFMFRTELADRGSPNNTLHREQFKAWAEVAKHLIWRPNTGGNYGWRIGRPSVSPTQTIEDFELLKQVGCDGIAVDVVWEHWSPHAPDYYLMGQLAWDPNLDGRAVLDDFYRRGFGPAAEDVKAYWRFIEETYQRIKATEEETWEAFIDVYDDAFFTKANDLLDDALGQLKGAPEKYRKRVAFLRLGLDWNELLMANQKLLRKWQHPAPILSDEERAQAFENGKRLVRLSWSNKFPHAVNGGPVRPQTGRMAKFMPEQLRSPGEYEKYLP